MPGLPRENPPPFVKGDPTKSPDESHVRAKGLKGVALGRRAKEEGGSRANGRLRAAGTSTRQTARPCTHLALYATDAAENPPKRSTRNKGPPSPCFVRCPSYHPSRASSRARAPARVFGTSLSPPGPSLSLYLFLPTLFIREFCECLLVVVVVVLSRGYSDYSRSLSLSTGFARQCDKSRGCCGRENTLVSGPARDSTGGSVVSPGAPYD